MKCVILAAGYGTRLYPLTKNTPKPLIKVKGKTVIEYIFDQIPLRIIDHIYIVTNNKFYQKFLQWHSELFFELPITIINDMTESNDDRLGSLGDLCYTIKQTKINDDFLLISGDNIFNFSIDPMVNEFFKGKNILALYDVKTKEEAKKMGIPTVNSNGLVTELIEKPEEPKSTVVSVGIYCFQQKVITLISQYIKTGNSADKVGEFIAWLCKEIDIFTYNYNDPNDIWLDIGTPSQLALAEELF